MYKYNRLLSIMGEQVFRNCIELGMLSFHNIARRKYKWLSIDGKRIQERREG